MIFRFLSNLITHKGTLLFSGTTVCGQTFNGSLKDVEVRFMSQEKIKSNVIKVFQDKYQVKVKDISVAWANKGR